MILNRKRCFLAVLSLFVATASWSQIRVDVMVSPQFNEDFSVRAGSDLNIPVTSRWTFVPGVYWSLRNRSACHSKSSEGHRTDISSTDRAHFIIVPVRMGYDISCRDKDKFDMRLLFGPYVAYGISGKSKKETNVEGELSCEETGAFDADGRYRGRWDYGVNVGLNATFARHYNVGVFCETGFRKIYNTDKVMEDVVDELFGVAKINIAFGLSLGYRF